MQTALETTSNANEPRAPATLAVAAAPSMG
jgi:hypothetical protein